MLVAFPVAFGLFVVTPFALYFTGLYELTMRHEWVHELTHAHFIAVGCLFFWLLIGLDPLPGRWPYLARAADVPVHAVPHGPGPDHHAEQALLGGDWYPSLGLSWTDPVHDQVVAGGILGSAARSFR